MEKKKKKLIIMNMLRKILCLNFKALLFGFIHFISEYF